MKMSFFFNKTLLVDSVFIVDKSICSLQVILRLLQLLIDVILRLFLCIRSDFVIFTIQKKL